MFSKLGTYINGLLDSIINSSAVSSIEFISMLLTPLLTIYFLVMGYLIIAGRIDMPFNKLMIDCGKFLFISAVCLNASNYLNWVVGSVHDLETGLVAAFSGSETANSSSVFSMLDQAVKKGFDLANKFFTLASSRDLLDVSNSMSDRLNGIIIVIATELLCVIAAFIIIVAKVGLTFMLGIGPVFISMLMFKPTSKFFDMWLGQTITYILKMVFVISGFMISIDIFNGYISNYKFNPAEDSTTSAFSLLGITVIATFILHELNSVAGTLGGGLSSQGVGAGQMIRGAMGAADSIGRGTVGATKGAWNTGKGIRKGYRRLRYGKDAINKDK